MDWLDEARTHWQHILAAAGAVRELFPVQELLRIVVVSLATAMLTSYVTVIRLDERITAIRNEREIVIKKRDEQIIEIKSDIQRLENNLTDLRERASRLEGKR
jgi:hypothetical protein